MTRFARIETDEFQRMVTEILMTTVPAASVYLIQDDSGDCREVREGDDDYPVIIEDEEYPFRILAAKWQIGSGVPYECGCEQELVLALEEDQNRVAFVSRREAAGFGVEGFPCSYAGIRGLAQFDREDGTALLAPDQSALAESLRVTVQLWLKGFTHRHD